MTKITYAITASTEINELKLLLDVLRTNIDFSTGEYELLIQLDSGNYDKFLYDYIVELIDSNSELDINLIMYPLNNNFGEFKNNLSKHSNGEYIFQIDADELLGDNLLDPVILKSILDLNNVEFYMVPRINTVVGITDEYVKSQGWSSEFKGFSVEETLQHKTINYPDYQGRIYKNLPSISWVGTVHERIVGPKTMTFFPQQEEYSLTHIKSFEKQISQNNLYKNIQG